MKDFVTGIGVIADIESTRISSSDIEILQSPALSGVILFARNYENPQQLKQLASDIRAIRVDLPIFADQEGGRVQRFREGFAKLPPMLNLGERFSDHPDLTLEASRRLGALMAGELFNHGVDVSFAPVLDIERGCSRVIGDRAFGWNSAVVSLLTESFVAGMVEIGMPAVGKHFPGHGAVEADSHLELPVDGRYLCQLDYDMRPFRYLSDRELLQGVMPAHVLYPAVDSKKTSGFSSRWVSLLREQVGFAGVIFSDDLSMLGAANAGTYGDRADLAVGAGCNALVVCNNRDGVQEVLKCVESLLREAGEKLDLAHWQVSRSVSNSFLNEQQQWLRLNNFIP